MASLDGISFDIETRPISRTILSSVGGFSQSARQNIRSLQDLLATIQRFNLQVFDSRSLQHKDYVGEGVSYRVSSCWHEANDRVYARKDVKLPPKTADAGAFDRQVACVLRDVEVMYGLAQRPNILDIFGYGWDIESGNVIPFLLTEFAEAGTMRQFLRRNEISLHEKLLFCKDVAQGLHAIHVAGIAHGDLKLDNILMRPYTNLGTSHSSEHEVLRTSLMQACISDFGHSLHLYDDEEDSTVKQRYGGTLAYNAPELLDKTHSRTDINFRKCDIWSLGLTCWEIILGGQAYYHTANVERIILSSPKGPASLPTPPPSNTGSQSSSATLLEELINVTPHLAMVASGDVSERAGIFISQAAVFRLCRVFRWCLCVDPAQRIADIPLLPIFHGSSTNSATPLKIEAQSGTSWSFKLFEVANDIPSEVKKQIASDCQKIANEPGNSIGSARASFQLGLAYISGFGLVQDPSEALKWFAQSSEKGLNLAHHYLPAFKSADTSIALSHEQCLANFLESNRAAFRARFEYFLKHDGTDASEQIKQRRNNQSDINLRDENGETCLTLASKLGLSSDTVELAAVASTFMRDGGNCLPIHWLFMHSDEDISRVAYSLTTSGELDFFAALETPLVLDEQLPLTLAGSPLAFAVSVHCTEAVKVLIDLGADVLRGLSTSYTERVKFNSPLCIAFRYHMADILDLILEACMHGSGGHADMVELLDELQTCAPALHLERVLVHGGHVATAAQSTIRILCKYYGFVPTVWTILKPAAHTGDVDFCIAVSEVLKDMGAMNLTTDQLDDLTLICTNNACQASRDMSVAIRMMNFAISQGCNLNCYRSTYKMPMHIIINHRALELLMWMTEHTDMDLNARDKEGAGILHHLIDKGYSGKIDLEELIKRGARPDAEDIHGRLPIEMVRNNQVDNSLIVLLKHTPAKGKVRFLWTAIKANATDLLQICLQDKELVSAYLPKKYIETLREALIYAAQVGSVGAIEVLIEAGASPVNLVPEDNYDLIHLAVRAGNRQVLEYCIKIGQDVNGLSARGRPLDIATKFLVERTKSGVAYSENAWIACCDLLLDSGASPLKISPGFKESPLMAAIDENLRYFTRQMELVKRMLTCRPLDTYHILKLGEEMCYVLYLGLYELVDAMLDQGVSVNCPTNDIGSVYPEYFERAYPLHIIAANIDPTYDQDSEDFLERPSAKLVAKFLEKGADPWYLNAQGDTALDLAIREDNGLIAYPLLEYMLHSKPRLTPPPQASFDLLPPINPRNIKASKRSSYSRAMQAVKEHWKSRRASSNIEKLTEKEDPACDAISFRYLNYLDEPYLEESWDFALSNNCYGSMASFGLMKAFPKTRKLSRRQAIVLFYLAVCYDLMDVVVLYTGGYDLINSNVWHEPDEYLASVWESIRSFYDCDMNAGQLLSLPYIVENGPPEPEKDAYLKMDQDEDIPEQIHDYAYHRIQLWHVVDQWSPIYPASHLVWRNFVEAQLEPGMIEVVVNHQAERDKQQRLALQYLLGPVGDDDYFI